MNPYNKMKTYYSTRDLIIREYREIDEHNLQFIIYHRLYIYAYKLSILDDIEASRLYLTIYNVFFQFLLFHAQRYCRGLY